MQHQRSHGACPAAGCMRRERHCDRHCDRKHILRTKRSCTRGKGNTSTSTARLNLNTQTSMQRGNVLVSSVGYFLFRVRNGIAEYGLMRNSALRLPKLAEYGWITGGIPDPEFWNCRNFALLRPLAGVIRKQPSRKA